MEIALTISANLGKLRRSGDCMRLKAIKDEAAKLILEMGSDAPEVAALETLKAKRQKNVRLAMFKAQVALEVSRQMRTKVT